MKNILFSLIVGLGVAFSATAQDTTDSVFNGNELSISLSTAYDGVESSFSDDYTFNLQGGVSYFVSKNLGLNATLPFLVNDSFNLEEVGVGGVLRVPVGHVAPYVGADLVYNWDASDTDYVGRAGVEVRLNKGWGVFAEGNYRVDDFSTGNVENGAWSVVAGVRLVIF